ncbi:aminotransferase class III-fold pyridoxal phosphate-dependent enzyme [Rhizobium ruizarguesonis]|jgi:adenosylmethionine-8-amino-7-oxononanoate aminotransferase|uniref:Aminotransferase class III-fold pyridoxal phosphate-dependent enzyme n=3 Tax=Rhizobium TaxID=379 RepID=A0AAE8TYR9_9HYPH|nr:MULTISPECIES: aminotransferase class III-fold pyridoxal phosphate-dependent enzyme [Rhizobium]NEJ21432.1 aminotransferase class III-fold pyridoxal phosphate-dependent enzyme [Rhizobium leguminosarum]MCB2402833.1 aminotransferase class III-fold pyridoxal phosphate-dependent enzyme [Rhizobium ruizarguesonis]NEH28775.1 aminotransferase class III-fold pyridoxal phosphate-dependent enzyme [Rhizobium ruizarguesonis]NEH37643.1 aminotransferase class III-fold pyridoxal phosphate-dependent enzyme [Rh
MADSNFLTEHNARHVWHPMAHPAEMRANPPVIISGGEGTEIIDIDGKRLLDGVGGLWNVNLGYSCDPVKQAITAQLNELPYYSAFRGTTNGPLIELSVALAEFFAPDGMVRSFFTSGGSDSVETALRLARQFHKLNGQAERTKFVSLKKGYHGTHFGGASVNGNQNFRRAYEPLLPGTIHLAAPYAYRNPFNTDDPKVIAECIVQQFADEIAFHGADTIAALIMEPVLGAGGVIVPHEGLMPSLRSLCDKHGILLIADEVITAFGRTGAWSGSRLWGVKPDLMCTAKAITNGYFPFGAVMIGSRVADVFEADRTAMGSIGHGYTYSGHPVGAAAAIACLAETIKKDLPSNAAARGVELFDGLEALKERYPLVGDVRGMGLMCAMELVSNREDKTPVGKDTVAKVYKGAYEAGVMVRTSGNNIILSPTLIITSQDVARILEALQAGLKAAGN